MHSINLLFNAKILFWKIFVWVQNFTFLLLPSEKASHKNGIYKNCILNFLTEKCFFFFWYNQNFYSQNKKNVLREFDDTILAKCLKCVWVVFFIDLVYRIAWQTVSVYDTISAKCLKCVWVVFFIDLVYRIAWQTVSVNPGTDYL